MIKGRALGCLLVLAEFLSACDPLRVAGLTPPSGTVTFLFTDIEGSTESWEAHESAMQDAVAAHDRILRSVIESGNGYVFTTAGDSFAASFQRVAAAVEAAVQIQRRLYDEDWPDPVRLVVRMGLHTGEASERDGDYFGPAVNLAARVMSKANGGQIVLSNVSASLLGGEFSVKPLGRHRVKGVAAPVELAQVLVPGLVSDFADIRGTQLAGNLLAQGASGELVGRSAELSELTTQLETSRLLTLTGVRRCRQNPTGVGACGVGGRRFRPRLLASGLSSDRRAGRGADGGDGGSETAAAAWPGGQRDHR